MTLATLIVPARRWLAALLLLPLLAAAEPVRLDGRTLSGEPWSLAAQRGKVVMVVFWSTGCPVCRDVLPELRRNYAGWTGQPFELVTVATDARRDDVVVHDRLVEQIVPTLQRFPTLWRGEAGHADGFGAPGALPATFVIDRSGQVAHRWNGRVPAEAWDRVAELLP